MLTKAQMSIKTSKIVIKLFFQQIVDASIFLAFQSSLLFIISLNLIDDNIFQMRLHPPGTDDDKESTKWEKAYKKVVRKRKRQQS